MWRSAARSIGACLALLCFFAVSSADPSPPSRADVTSGVRVAQRLIDTIPSPWRLDGDVRMAGDDAPVAQGNFVQASYALNKASLDSIATFSRAGTAMQFDSQGYLTYGPNNLLTYSNTFSNAAWTLSTATLTSGISDPDGGTSAWTLTATGAGALLYQNVTVPSTANGLFAVWVKRRTGSGTISLRQPAGAYTPITVTGSWALASIVGLGNGAVNIAIQIATSGDAIDIYKAAVSAVTYETTPRAQDQVITTSAAYYGPRFDYTYNGSSWVPAGLLVEGAATNLALQSNTLSNASWSRNLVSAPAQNVAGIDGTTSAWTVTASGAADTFLYQMGSFIGPTTYSGVFKAGTNNWVYIAANGGGAKRAYVFFDLTNGVVGSTTFRPDGAYAGTLTDYGMVPLGNGFYRCYMSVTGTTDTYFAFGFSDANGDAATTSGRTVIMGELQAEAAASMSSITRTTTASVTRAAETVQLTGTALSTLQGASGTVIAQIGPTVNSGISQTVVGAATVHNTPILLSTNKAYTYSSAAVFFQVPGTLSLSSDRVGVAWSPSGRSAAANGGSIGTDANTISGLAAAYLGSVGSSYLLNGHIASVAFYNSRLPDATLQSKSVVGASYAANDNGIRYAFADNDNLPVHWRVAL